MSRRNAHAFGLPLALALALAMSAVVACGGRSESPTSQSGLDASMDASTDAVDETLPPGVAYFSGGVRCCAKGTGRQCCIPGVPCHPYGGSGGECVGAGDSVSGKDTCAICCDGPGLIYRMNLVDGQCVSDNTHPEEEWLSAACGDGVCSAAHGENVCSCPEDCP